MYRLEYTPRALNDMIRAREEITSRFGAKVAEKSIRKLTASARRLEKFPEEGPRLEGLIMVPTEYRYLYVKPNYLFYRIEGQCVKVIRVLRETQDFLQTLFGITATSEDALD